MQIPAPTRRALWVLPLAVALLGPDTAVFGQASESSDGQPTDADTRVGYIDGAIPGDQFRLRYEAGYDFTRGTRAEFFYARSGPSGPGLPKPEPRIDYQDLSAYLELMPRSGFSAFVEVPWRFLNPEVNPDANGLGDMNAGFKYAFIDRHDLVATFQFRTYAPTGEAHRGLGNDHVSLEPALLVYKPFSDRLRLEGEFRPWVPVGGTDFSGPIIRYGLGLDYDIYRTCNLRITPVIEGVAWTVVGGKESFVTPSGLVGVQDAAGDTIVNIKLGIRTSMGRHSDIYAGYGRALSGDRWYENVFRLEYRLSF
jgi:hypothetical protein